MSIFARLRGFLGDIPTPPSSTLPLFLHDTLTNANIPFVPLGKMVRMYNCGPTVYGRQHLGNLSMFVFTDILRRTLEFNGFPVKQVINITDVGHLTSDGDEGEDKMAKGLKREGLAPSLQNMRTMAEKYAALFLADIGQLGVDTARISFPRATEHIPGQIALIETLMQKGYVYKTPDGLYFNTGLFKGYGKLGSIDVQALKAGARVETNVQKKHPADFALWKFNREIGWETPWGKGFPGWHIECSAMARSELGEQLDIHTGGIEHIAVHHNNEIAQSEAATGKEPFSRIWMHRAHLQLDGRKMAKSEGNVLYLSDIMEKGIEPLAFRYALLQSHYRTPSSVGMESLEAAQTALHRLRAAYQHAILSRADPALPPPAALRAFHERINQDLDTPGALAVVWNTVKEQHPPAALAVFLEEVDRIFGLSLSKLQEGTPLPEHIRLLATAREKARREKDWTTSDRLRVEIEAAGFSVHDTAVGQEVRKVA